MNIAILGCGDFGSHLIGELNESKHKVIVIDRDDEVINSVRHKIDKAVVGDCRDITVLRKCGVDLVEKAIITIKEIEVSILAALHLKDLHIPEIYCVGTTEEHGRILEKIGITKVIFPARESAVRLAQTLTNKNIIDQIPLSEGYSIMELAPPVSFLNKSLRELDLPGRRKVQVIAFRDPFTRKLDMSPNGTSVITDSTVLIVLGSNEALSLLESIK